MAFSSQRETNSEQTLVNKKTHAGQHMERKQDWFGKNPWASTQSKPHQISMEKNPWLLTEIDNRVIKIFKKLNKRKQDIPKKAIKMKI